MPVKFSLPSNISACGCISDKHFCMWMYQRLPTDVVKDEDYGY